MGWVDLGLKLAVGGGSVGALLLGLVYVFQEKLLYVPHIPGLPDFIKRWTPELFDFDSEDVWLTADDGTKLHAWLLLPRGWSAAQAASAPLVLFFQENAGSMTHRLPFLRALARKLGVAVFAPSYRGYGRSEGRPNQRGLMLDAQAALDHLRGRSDINRDKIVVFGRSLGGAVALHLAAENQDAIKALIIENTFLSVEDMVPQVLPPLGAVIGGPGKPLNCLVTNKWRNLAEIQRITALPLLLMACERDEMVPFKQMLALREAAATPHLAWQQFPTASHMDAYEVDKQLYWPALQGFLEQYVLPGGGGTAGAFGGGDGAGGVLPQRQQQQGEESGRERCEVPQQSQQQQSQQQGLRQRQQQQQHQEEVELSRR